MSDLDALDLPATPPTLSGATGRKCTRHRWVPTLATGTVRIVGHHCEHCGAIRDEERARRGRTSRDYGTRAELKIARTYGGAKIGQAGGPVDVRGAEWHTQVKTHRRLPPREWRDAFAGMAASTDRLPRLILRFVFPGGPEDYVVVPGKAWLDWYGKDE
jgi:hypothetical protein